MSCANCGAKETGYSWSGVPVCENCYRLASSLMKRNEKQLRAMLIICENKIRACLLSSKLRVQANANIEGSKLCSNVQATLPSLRKRPEHELSKKSESGTGD